MRKPLTISRNKAAALFIDLQEEHRKDKRFLAEGFDAVVANAVRLQAAARENALPLFHCAYVVDLDSGGGSRFHPTLSDGKSVFSDKNDPLTAICAEVAPQNGEPLLFKREASGFGDGRLAPLLASQEVEWLFVAGVWTEACIYASVKDALALGLRIILIKDACGSGTAAMHQTAILNLANRLYGGAVTDTDGACRLMRGQTIDAWQIDGAVPFRYSYETAAAIYDSL